MSYFGSDLYEDYYAYQLISAAAELVETEKTEIYNLEEFRKAVNKLMTAIEKKGIVL